MEEVNKMFEKLGYTETKQISFRHFMRKEIAFNLTDEVVIIGETQIGMNTLRAIIEQCKDLGWLNERSEDENS